jgi:acetyl esterase/lipase
MAPTRMLEALPDDIVLFCCEWDMLLAEGEKFKDRLQNELGKRVTYVQVKGVPHGWDKSPNPLKESPGAREQYMVACKELKRMFEDEDAASVVGHSRTDLQPSRTYQKSYLGKSMEQA